jgi:hypothetical protein
VAVGVGDRHAAEMGAVAVGDEPALVAVLDAAQERVTRGPAPINLPIPPYAFQGDTKVRIGEGATA